MIFYLNADSKLQDTKLTMATEEESIQVEENPRKRARENSAVQLQEGLSKLCKILQEIQAIFGNIFQKSVQISKFVC